VQGGEYHTNFVFFSNFSCFCQKWLVSPWQNHLFLTGMHVRGIGNGINNYFYHAVTLVVHTYCTDQQSKTEKQKYNGSCFHSFVVHFLLWNKPAKI